MAQWLNSERFGNGSDGAVTLSGTDAPIDSVCSGTSGTTTLSATNASFATNQIILIHQTRGTGVGNWELNVISSYSAGTITTKYSLSNTYTNSGNSRAQVLVLKQYSSVTISGTLTGKDWDPNTNFTGGIVAFLCNGTTTISGTVDVKGDNAVGQGQGNALGFTGGSVQAGVPSGAGEGSAGASVAQQAANGNGGGGANDSQNRGYPGGGGGGNGTAGSNGSPGSGDQPGNGGNTSGSANLTTMTFGGGGGAATGGGAGGGGASGGIVVIFSKIFNLTGSITVNGGNGGNGGSTLGGGGGGAGGSVLIKGQKITLGTNLVTATGGTGGTGGGGGGGNGGNAGVGRIHADYSQTISGTTNPTLDSTQDSSFNDIGGGAFFGLF